MDARERIERAIQEFSDRKLTNTQKPLGSFMVIRGFVASPNGHQPTGVTSVTQKSAPQTAPPKGCPHSQHQGATAELRMNRPIPTPAPMHLSPR